MYHRKNRIFLNLVVCRLKLVRTSPSKMASPLRKKDGEYDNAGLHIVKMESGDCIPTFRFLIHALPFLLLILLRILFSLSQGNLVMIESPQNNMASLSNKKSSK